MSNDKLLDKLVVTEIKTQSDYLADNIKNMIISGEFEYGYSFPNENEFCKMLNVSRATLREAYKILDTQGFIQRTKHGTYVKRREEIARQGNFTASLELAEKQELAEFICALEPEAVYLATKKIRERESEKLEELEKLMFACEAAGNDTKQLIEHNYEFHSFIRELADNTLITSALTAYYDIFNQQVIKNIYDTRDDVDEFRENSLKQHRELFEAIKKGDADEAKKIAYEHLVADINFEGLPIK